MAHRRITDEDLLGRALALFRKAGFEGVSINELATATGLEKASLYYRFPGGKEEIALAVLEHVGGWFDANVSVPLRAQATPRKRVQMVCERLAEFYGNGTLSCVTDVMSLPSGSEEIADKLKRALQGWLRAFTDIARESGFTASDARSRAEAAVIGIQGSLVLSRVLGSASPFRRVMKDLPDLLTRS